MIAKMVGRYAAALQIIGTDLILSLSLEATLTCTHLLAILRRSEFCACFARSDRSPTWKGSSGQTLLSSLVGLLDVLLLIMFLFIIFSIIFLQLFKGKLHQQCYHNVTVGNSTVEQWVDVDGLPKFCNVDVDVRGPGGIPCSAHAESEGWVCGTEISCVESMDPLAGLRSFDNIGLALLNVTSSSQWQAGRTFSTLFSILQALRQAYFS